MRLTKNRYTDREVKSTEIPQKYYAEYRHKNWSKLLK